MGARVPAGYLPKEDAGPTETLVKGRSRSSSWADCPYLAGWLMSGSVTGEANGRAGATPGLRGLLHVPYWVNSFFNNICWGHGQMISLSLCTFPTRHDFWERSLITLSCTRLRPFTPRGDSHPNARPGKGLSCVSPGKKLARRLSNLPVI